MMTSIDRRTILRGAAAGTLAAPALIGPAIAQGQVRWRVQAHWPKASASFDDSLVVLAQRLEEATEGRFQLELFGAGEFAKGGEIFNLVRRGVVEMGSNSPAYWLDEAQTAAFVMGIPGTLREPWQQMHYLKNMGVEATLKEELAELGVYYASEKVYPTELVVNKDIKSLADFQSLKLRSAGTMLDYLASTGAAAQLVEGPEIYQSLSSGVIDGAHWGAAVGAQSMSFWEVAKFHLKPGLGFTTDCWIVNLDALNDLDEDLRLIFTSLMEERFYLRSTEYQLKEQIALSQGEKDLGVTVVELPQDVLDKFAEASAAILEKEAQRGEKAEVAAGKLRDLMGELGYV